MAKHRHTSEVEKMYYELKPFLFLALALYGIARSSGSTLLGVSSLLLMTCAGLILHARLRYRTTRR